MPLRWRLAVVFALATAVVLSIGGLLLVNLVQRSLMDSLHSRLTYREEVMGRLVATYGDELRTRPLRTDRLEWPYPPESEQLAQLFAPDDTLVQSIQVPDDQPLLTREQVRAARRAPLEFRSLPGTPGDGDLLRASAVTSADGDRWVVVVGADLSNTDAVLRRLRTGLLLAGPLGIGLSALGAWLLAGASLRPVERLRRQAAELSADDTGASLPIPATGDEIAALASTMNDLLHRLQDALTRQRRLVGDAGHELRTPLTVLRAELELASRPGRSLPELREAVGFAGVETDRLIRLTEHLLLLARIDEGQPMLHRSPSSLREILATAVRAVQARAYPRRVVLVAPDDVVLLADAERIRQAVDDLLDNAIRFAPPDTEVTVTLRRQDAAQPPRAVIEVADRGPGFPEDFLDRAFERFERADAARTRDTGGSGLGLSIVRSLLRAHGGDASASNRDGGGAVVRLELPLEGPTTDDDLPAGRPVATRHP